MLALPRTGKLQHRPSRLIVVDGQRRTFDGNCGHDQTLGQPSCQTLPPSTVVDSLRRQPLRESCERERTEMLLEPANRPAPAHRLASGAHRGPHQPAASIPSASSRSALFRERWAISWPTAMAIAIGHSTTSNSAITVRPTYQATCSGLRESATGTRERRLAPRFTPRPTGTRPFVAEAGRTIVVVDSLRLGAALAPPERDFNSGPTIRGPPFSFVPWALPASIESTVLAPYPRSSSTRCHRAREFRAGSHPCLPRCPAQKWRSSR